ncbi:RNA polymerase II subunit A C-terminal domain phosphatase [Harpegnathos saltator]|uniref:RNA polymerase II subunit A C-terminal domain phosphatase n=1 Tax=Harpegnathos saltator TaxID=610380 RepID=E2B8Q6_HARSA|nr:RNA polymerase II subunit A C-terminal domain phosphatase [Harpegnathos saltator]
MAAIEIIFPLDGPPGKILKWRVRSDTMVATGRVLLLYRNASSDIDDTTEPEKKLRATRFGRVKKLLVKEGDVVQPGQVIILLEGCTHPTVMIDLCAECGADLRVEQAGKDGKITEVSQASVPMVHSIPELKVCPELAEKIGKKDEQRLLKDRKLVLLVDLDQTIVHTTNDHIPPNLKDVHHFQLYGPNSPWYHTRLRPNTRHFLSEMSHLYELHICSFGARIYAHTIASLLDKDGVLFSHRILSRDECFDPASKTANLKALFPCGDDLVCIIDDREDVWQGCGNLVQVKPYHFFRHTGDINAPPGLDKGDAWRTAESENTNINETCANSKNKDDKNETSESIEALSLGDISTKETSPEADENYDKSKEADNDKQDTKVDTEEETDIKSAATDEAQSTAENEAHSAAEDKAQSTAENEAQSNAASKDDTIDKEVAETAQPEETEKNNKQETSKSENNVIDEDDDDYLLYLEDILRRIHTEFYCTLDKGNGRRSLRDIIPRVRSQVLKGLYLTFSGLIPTHQKLHQSRAYKVARAFGAEVTQDLTEKTTHLVAIRKGTAKANAAKKDTNIKIVNPEWLWTCAERWEHVDERLFPVTSQARGSRVPPPHCSSPESVEEVESNNSVVNSFANTINPLMSFTQEEIDFMDKEVEEDMLEQDMLEEDFLDPDFDIEHIDDEELIDTRIRRRSYDSEDSMDSNLGDNSDSIQDSIDFEDGDEDDREWNALGAALEREFLAE